MAGALSWSRKVEGDQGRAALEVVANPDPEAERGRNQDQGKYLLTKVVKNHVLIISKSIFWFPTIQLNKIYSLFRSKSARRSRSPATRRSRSRSR